MHKELSTLFDTLPYKACIGSRGASIDALSLDSRTVTPTTLFIAQRGETVDGHSFIEAVVEKGVRVVVCEVLPPVTHPEVTYIVVPNSHYAAGIIAVTVDFP